MASFAPITLTSPATGFATFQVAHNWGAAPTSMPQLNMLSGGAIWFDQTLPYDATYLYLHASDAGLVAEITPPGIAAVGSGSAYTNLLALAAMFPAWIRGGANQQPTDAQVTLILNDVASRINAVIGRRFREAMTQAGFSTAYAYAQSLSSDALNFLEQLNRWGAAMELAETFASFGNKSAAAQGARYGARFQADFNELNGEDAAGKPDPTGGDFDYLFDPQAKTPTPRPTMWGIAGGDQPLATLEEEGLYSKFGRDDPKGT